MVATAHRVKRAQGMPGEMGPDSGYEAAFSNLAHTFIADRAPGLLDHMVGFQMLDQEDEGTRAVGVYGFQVGKEWLYVPVFWINGELKGQDLLYLKNQDQFVPLKEGWVNDILAKRPVELGRPYESESPGRGGSSDLHRLFRGGLKAASAPVRDWLRGLPPWAAEAAVTFAKVAADADREYRESGLLHLLGGGHVKAASTFSGLLHAFPRLGAAFDALYDAAEVKAAAAQAKAAAAAPRPRPLRTRPGAPRGRRVKRAHLFRGRDPEAEGRLTILTRDAGSDRAPSLLVSDADRTRLWTEGVVIKDAREEDEVSRAVTLPARTQTPRSFQGPAAAGVYTVPFRARGLLSCVVLPNPQGVGGRLPHALVFTTDRRPRRWANLHPSTLMTLGPGGALADWLDEQPAVGVGALKRGAVYVAVSPDGDATVPFEVREDLGTDAQGGRVYRVAFRDHVRGGPVSDLLVSAPDVPGFDRWADGERVHLGMPRGTTLHATRGDVYIPDGYTVLLLEPSRSGGADEDDRLMAAGPGDGSLVPMDAEAVIEAVRRGYPVLEVRRDGDRVWADGEALGDLKAARAALVRDWGLRDAAAVAALDAADRASRRNDAARLAVKYAAGYPRRGPTMVDGLPRAPELPGPDMTSADVLGEEYPELIAQTDHEPVEDLEAEPDDRSPEERWRQPEPRTLQVAHDAARSGRRDVFDASMLGTILHATRDDAMVDRYVPDLMKGLDRPGRIRFAMYWHTDAFADRFGKDETPELEDLLKSAFEVMGDLILVLKQKTVESPHEDEGMDLEIQEAVV